MPPTTMVDVEGQTMKAFTAPRSRTRPEGKDHRPVLVRAKDSLADMKLGVLIDWKLWGILASIVIIGILVGHSMGGDSSEPVHTSRDVPTTAHAVVAPKTKVLAKPAAEPVEVSKPDVAVQEAAKPVETVVKTPPVEPAKPVEAAVSVEPAVEPAKPTETAQLAETVQPADTAQPAEAAAKDNSPSPDKMVEVGVSLFDEKIAPDITFTTVPSATPAKETAKETARPPVEAADLFSLPDIGGTIGLPTPIPTGVSGSAASSTVIPPEFGNPIALPKTESAIPVVPIPFPDTGGLSQSLPTSAEKPKFGESFAEFPALNGETVASTLQRRAQSLQRQGGGLKVVSLWNGGQCKSLYKASISHPVKNKPERIAFKKKPLLLDMYKTTAGWRPTGAEMPEPIFMQRHVTWEDSHIKDPNGNLQVDVDETIALWLGTHVRAVAMLRPKNWHDFKTLEAFPFVAPAVPRTALTAIKAAAAKLGHQLGPLVKTSFEVSENVGRAKVVAFVRDPIDRLLAAYVDMNHKLSLKGHVPENAVRFLDKKSRFFHIKEEPERFRAFVQDIKNGLWFWRGEDVITQSYFLAATDEHGGPLHYHFIGKVENLAEDWLALEKLLKVKTPEPGPQPAANDTRVRNAMHWFDERTLKMVCEIYAQDFLCLGYPVPSQCHTVIKATITKKYTPVRPSDLMASPNATAAPAKEATWDGESAPKVGPALVDGEDAPALAEAAALVVGNPATKEHHAGAKGKVPATKAPATKAEATKHAGTKEHHAEHHVDHSGKGVKHPKGKDKER